MQIRTPSPPAAPARERPVAAPTPPARPSWLRCTLFHGRHWMYHPRYLGGYTRCRRCGRRWE
jgi:hypothetical protein